jgi:hypothetical protein
MNPVTDLNGLLLVCLSLLRSPVSPVHPHHLSSVNSMLRLFCALKL